LSNRKVNIFSASALGYFLKERSRLGLSRYASEAAEQAAVHRDKLGIAGKVKDVAGVHKTLWPDQPETKPILNLAILTGEFQPRKTRPDDESGDDPH
jgi:hypothetical protein